MTKFRWLPLLLGVLLLPPAAATAEAEGVTTVKVTRFFGPNNPNDPTTRSLLELMRRDPRLHIEEWGGLSLPGGAGRASLMMAIAGKTAPDIGESWFHSINNDIRQNFLYPLNEWIGEDKNGNGQIDDDEAIWEPWKRIPPLWRRAATRDGRVYGIPQAGSDTLGLIFRIDLVRAAGLNPNRPPRTWDELFHWCQKLTDPTRKISGAVQKRGARGIGLPPNGFMFLPWMQAAGGEPIVQLRRSPRNGKEYRFAPDAGSFLTPEGEDLSNVEPVWRANFASPECMAAARFYHKLMWQPWLVDPESGEPVNLSEEDLDRKQVEYRGRLIAFTEKQVIVGVARGQTGQRGTDTGELLGRGEVAMIPSSVADLEGRSASIELDPDLLSWCPIPAGPPPGGRRVVQIQRHYAVMFEGVGDRPKEARDKVWRVMEAIVSQQTLDNSIRDKVLSGLTRFADPRQLKRLGYEDYIAEIPEAVRRNFAEIDSGKIGSFTEPWMGFWITMDMALNNQVLSLLISESGRSFDYEAALRKVEEEANSGQMFGTSEEVLKRYRPVALAVLVAVAAVIAVFVACIVRSWRRAGREVRTGARNVTRWYVAWLLVGPALLLILLWSYYPLLRGMVMAFQDYKIGGGGSFVGLDNFIVLVRDGSFWMSLVRTVYFVFLNMTLAFTMPIILAVLLTEVPRFKITFRTLFFLPQMTSGLVIALLWKLMYEPTPDGFFNQMIGYLNMLPFVHIEPQTWLQDPDLAMICCVIPTVWASMGMASLIYLAALHSVPAELYEAAEVDGAGIFRKLWSITLPTLLPLIIINFVGTFIGTFQNMGNIFLMTFGGPGEATTVAGLKIWIEAYNNLRFSMATSMAWVLGSLLIGFTYLQIRFLNRVEYRRAKD